MQPDHAPPPAATTIVRGGGAIEVAPTITHSFSGGVLHVSHVQIDEHIAYSQASDRHLLHATLKGHTSRSAGRIGQGDWRKLPDRRGSVSFTPGAHERHASVGSGRILGLQVELDRQFVEDACEQPLRSDWRAAFNADDAKAFAIAELIGTGVAQGACDRLTLDMLLLALGRHVGRAYAKADRRRDDGWLHPAALARIVDQLRADPGRTVPLHEMARSAGLGVSAFVRAFRGSTGTTPAAFARKLRLEHAADILRSTDLGAREVAALSGFASAAHLVRSFRAHRGVTPGRWRREAGPEETGAMSRNPRKTPQAQIGDTPG